MVHGSNKKATAMRRIQDCQRALFGARIARRQTATCWLPINKLGGEQKPTRSCTFSRAERRSSTRRQLRLYIRVEALCQKAKSSTRRVRRQADGKLWRFTILRKAGNASATARYYPKCRKGLRAGLPIWAALDLAERSGLAEARARASPARFFAMGNLGQYIYVALDRAAVLVRFGTGFGDVNWIGVLRELASRIP